MLGACYCRPWWRSYPQASEVFNDPRTWPRTRRLDALALALVREDAGLPRGTELAAACLLSSLESYRHGALAAYAEARQFSERALTICEKALRPDHSNTVRVRSILASLLRNERS